MLQWPNYWKDEIFRDITYLELIPIALAIFLWGSEFKNKKILFHCDNAAVVFIINNKSSKSDRVMSLLRYIVYCSLSLNVQLKTRHISSITNTIADALSRGQVDRFKKAAIPLSNTSSVLEPFVLEANKLIEASISRSTRLTYEYGSFISKF